VGAVSRMSIKDYVIANLIGKFPSTALEVVIGHDVVNLRAHSVRLTVLVIVAAALSFTWSTNMCCAKRRRRTPSPAPPDRIKHTLLAAAKTANRVSCYLGVFG
jgi:membrane protein DedA with SNARE-associated domain